MKYDIWMEGFNIQGQRAQASLRGSVEAGSFQEACDKMYGDDKLYDSDHRSFWGCQLFDNEQDARKRFG